MSNPCPYCSTELYSMDSKVTNVNLGSIRIVQVCLHEPAPAIVASLSPLPVISILTTEHTSTTITSISPPHAKPTTSLLCKFYMQGNCQYCRRGKSYPNAHPSMCFKFLHYGTRGCNKLDYIYAAERCTIRILQLVDPTGKN